MKTTTNARIGNTERHVGIDVGKSVLDVCIYELDKHWQVANTPTGIKGLLNQLNRYKLTRVLVEATGGYERVLAEACVAKELPILLSSLFRSGSSQRRKAYWRNRQDRCSPDCSVRRCDEAGSAISAEPKSTLYQRLTCPQAPAE